MNEIELTTVLTNEKESEHRNLLDVESKMPKEELYVSTRYGQVWVVIQGDISKTPFVTYPDIGLTSNVQYHGFFNFDDNLPVMKKFCAVHINPPGQEENAPSLPKNYSYPSCDQQAEIVMDVIDHFKLKGVICFGIGMGANILARFALLHPDFVAACAFMNLISTKAGWVEWGYQKWNNWYLASGQYTEFTKNYLLWHHFGYHTWEKCHDLVETYTRIFSRVNPSNLSHLIGAYINRTDLGIERKNFETKDSNTPNFKMPVLNVMGDMTPHDDDVIDTNGRLDPETSSYVKMADCGGMVLEEQPAKLAEALRCFLQGMGYVPHLSVTEYSISNRHSIQAHKQKEFLKQNIIDKEQNVLSSVDFSIPYTDTKPVNA